jgi:hypothetical protein
VPFVRYSFIAWPARAEGHVRKDDSGLHWLINSHRPPQQREDVMGKVIITTVITVDGLIEDPVPAPEGWLILEGDHEPPEFEMWQNAAGKPQLSYRRSIKTFPTAPY